MITFLLLIIALPTILSILGCAFWLLMAVFCSSKS